jgi:hypothetical protein
MSCGCNHLEGCDGCAPCNCCTPCPPAELPICNDPEPCDIALDSQCVIYTGGDLPCIGINGGNPPSVHLNDILEAIDAAMCRAGVGATFVDNTNCITLSGLGTQTSPIVANPIISPTTGNLLYCAGNGLLAKLYTTNTNCITLSGTGTSGSPLSASPVISSVAGNMLTCTGTGLYVAATNIPAATINVANSGCIVLGGDGSVGSPLTATITTGDGISCVGGALKLNLTANNGLTMSSSTNVQLGGTLIKNTTVDLSGYTLSLISNAGTGNATGIIITPGTFTDCVGCAPTCNPYVAYDWNTNTNEFWGKNYFHNVSRFDNNVGIGTTPDSNVVTCGNGTKLSVERGITGPFTSHGTFSAFRGAGGSALTLNGALGDDGNPTSGGGYAAETNAGWGTTLNMNPTTNVTLINHDPYNHAVTYSGSKSGISLGGDNGGLSILGQLAAYTSRSLFSDLGGVIAPNKDGMSLETYIGFQAESPQAYGSNKYTGTLTNAIGVKIESQRSGMGPDETSRLAGNGKLLNSYGIVQGHETIPTIGIQDKNIFNGPAAFYNNVAIGLNNVQNRFNTGNVQVPGTRLFTYRSEALTSEAITVASNSILELGGPTSSWSGNCSIYAGAFDYLYWAPFTNIDMTNLPGGYDGRNATFTGQGSYLTIATPKITTNGNMASNTAQVFHTTTYMEISGVNSSGSTVTVPAGTLTNASGLTVTAGSMVRIISGTGAFAGQLTVYVGTVGTNSFTLVVYPGPNNTSGAPVLYTPSTTLSNATIQIDLAGGSVDKVIAYRAKGPVPYQIGGSLLNINTAVGLQIDDQRAYMPSSWSVSIDKPVGTLGDSYGIFQVGSSDINKFNGTFELSSSTNPSIGTATLVAGTVTVSTTAAKTGSRIFISRNTPGGTPGHLSAPVASIVNGTSFVINSSSATDTSTVNWWVINN